MAGQADSGRVDPDRQALLDVLTRHRVAFVLIGGAAIQSYGRSYDTQDIDLTPDTAPENLARLATALNELNCRLITDPSDVGSWVSLPRACGIWRPSSASSISASRLRGSLAAIAIYSRAPASGRLPERPSWCLSQRSRTSTSRSVRPIDQRIARTSNTAIRPTPRRSSYGFARVDAASPVQPWALSVVASGCSASGTRTV